MQFHEDNWINASLKNEGNHTNDMIHLVKKN